jgi:hypothetical protein
VGISTRGLSTDPTPFVARQKALYRTLDGAIMADIIFLPFEVLVWVGAVIYTGAEETVEFIGGTD